MKQLICFLEELWNDIRYAPPAPISGHVYDSPEKSEVYLDHVVMVDYCSRCGDALITHCTREMYEQMKAKGLV